MRDGLDHLRRATGGGVTLARLVESYDPPLHLPGLMKASERGRTETVRRAVRILAKRGYAELAYQGLKSGHVRLLHQPAGEPARLVARWLGEEAEREARVGEDWARYPALWPRLRDRAPEKERRKA